MQAPATEVRIRSTGGAVLAATYSPAGETAIIALHSATAGARRSPTYRHLHELLPRAGIGVLTFDRRGEGASTGEPSRGRFQLQVEDALALVDALDVKHVGLWGLSQGAWIGPLAAVASTRVAFLVLVASTGVTPSEQMMYAVGCQLRLAGYDAVVDRVLDLRRRFEAWVHTPARDGAGPLSSELRSASAAEWWPHAWLPAELPDEEGRRLWIEEMNFDPVPVLAGVSVPTLLFYGAADAWTPVAASVAAWRAARPDDVEIVVIPEAEHDLTLPGGGLSDLYTRTLVAWLADQSRRAAEV
jgi:pimeloyl-ACP methyl ester carboxylesterase